MHKYSSVLRRDSRNVVSVRLMLHYLIKQGSGVQMFGTTTTSIFKSMLSKCAHKDEYGKVLSFVICTELSLPFISGPMYNFIYVQTVASLPGTIFWVAAGFTAIVISLCG